ncbi:hypothetical protein REPUB_Repub09cG0040500 [Reevesia pubescens]
MVLKLQEVSLWTTFGHVACNGAIMEAFEGETKLHVFDISNTYCTQRHTLLEALATHIDETPYLKLTTIVASKHGGVSDFSVLNIKEDEALAINCVGTLHLSTAVDNRRAMMISSFRRLQPRIIMVVEEEADLDVEVDGLEFVKGFQECLKWFRVYFEALDESFARISNESSSYDDTSYFLQALFNRMTDSSERCYRTLASVSISFESTRKMVLKLQEVSLWITFGHVACNGAIMEAFEGETKLHVFDISNTYCTQRHTLLEALATRIDETPYLKLTTIVASKHGGVSGVSDGLAAVRKIMKEIGNRVGKFARLMGVSFKFNVIHPAGDLCDLDFSVLDIKEDEALAINCVGTLHLSTAVDNRRAMMISSFRRLQPRIITVVEEEADLDVEVDGLEFVKGFQECLKWFRVYFEALDESFARISNERLMLERAGGRAIVDLVGNHPF